MRLIDSLRLTLALVQADTVKIDHEPPRLGLRPASVGRTSPGPVSMTLSIRFLSAVYALLLPRGQSVSFGA
jgi:hypothetical protein